MSSSDVGSYELKRSSWEMQMEECSANLARSTSDGSADNTSRNNKENSDNNNDNNSNRKISSSDNHNSCNDLWAAAAAADPSRDVMSGERESRGTSC